MGFETISNENQLKNKENMFIQRNLNCQSKYKLKVCGVYLNYNDKDFFFYVKVFFKIMKRMPSI